MPTILSKPITVAMAGDNAKDAIALQKGFEEFLSRLILLARHFNIPLETPQDLIELMSPLTLRLLENHPGFQLRLIRKAGRAQSKPPAYYCGLVIAFEAYCLDASKKTKTDFAHALAEFSARPNNPGRPGRKQRILALNHAAQIQNDLARVSNSDLNALARRIVKAIVEDNLTASEIAQMIATEQKISSELFHKNE